MRDLNIGALVQMYAYSANGDSVDEPGVVVDASELAHDRHHRHGLFTGLYMGWDHSDNGWIVLINGKLETFASTWWKCRRAT
jgi:hypothetical protein